MKNFEFNECQFSYSIVRIKVFKENRCIVRVTEKKNKCNISIRNSDILRRRNRRRHRWKNNININGTTTSSKVGTNFADERTKATELLRETCCEVGN
jgi:hypothetical protein